MPRTSKLTSSGIASLLTFALVFALFPVVPLFAQERLLQTAPAPVEQASPRPLLKADNPTHEVIRQAYELLLDRYVQPLNPADLLNAAYGGVAGGLSQRGLAVTNPGPLTLEPAREKAWDVFQTRLTALLGESPPPADFSVSEAGVTGMARWVDEGHTAFMTAQQYQDFLAYLRGDVRYGGIGVRPKRPGMTIAEVFPGSPAEAAGLLPGDVIMTVDGQQIDGKTLEQVAQLIRGPEGTTVRLEVDRPRSGQRLVFQIVRGTIKVEYIRTDFIQNDVAYVRLYGFPESSVADRFEQFLDTLHGLSLRGLIIDLRGNSGGRVDLGTRLLNRFIASGPLFDSVDRTGRHRVQLASGPGWNRPLPVAILIDEATASMGEIFASAMRERGVARLFGKTTSGTVAAAQVYPLGDGSALQITILEIFSGDGARLNRSGVVPDVALDTAPEELEYGRDIPLEAAVQYVWEKFDRTAAAGNTGGIRWKLLRQDAARPDPVAQLVSAKR